MLLVGGLWNEVEKSCGTRLAVVVSLQQHMQFLSPSSAGPVHGMPGQHKADAEPPEASGGGGEALRPTTIVGIYIYQTWCGTWLIVVCYPGESHSFFSCPLRGSVSCQVLLCLCWQVVLDVKPCWGHGAPSVFGPERVD